MDLLHDLTDSEKLLTYGGMAAILLVIFAETGLLIGFFLPGDYFLFLAGAFSGCGKLNVSYLRLVLCAFTAAVAGNFTGYYIGKLLGDKLFVREESLFFKRSYIARTRVFYEKYGIRALVLGRFLPIIRTFVPVLAGAVHLDFKKFAIYNLVGGALWVGVLISLGFYFGTEYPDVMNYALFIILGFIAVTTLPVIGTWRRFKNADVSATGYDGDASPKDPELEKFRGKEKGKETTL
jgi:membrane-associated protein